MKSRKENLRAELLNLLDEYEAMLVLLGQMNNQVMPQLVEQRASIQLLARQELLENAKHARRTIRDLRRRTGASKKQGYYSEFIKHVKNRDSGVLLLPAYMALYLFEKHPIALEALKTKRWPPHACLELDQHGVYPPQSSVQVHILEAVLFEDMCFAWNRSCSFNENPADPYRSKTEVKEMAFLHRAAVSSAFYMVEAYCNGLALEVHLTRGKELTDRELAMVTEWDKDHDRPKYLKIRDKILHYPRLIVGSQSPPIQENNCTALNFFLKSGKELRDSIVHASPSWEPGTLDPSKSRRLIQLDHAYCSQVVDSAVSVIMEIAQALDRSDSIFWLQTRRDDGLFDASVVE